MAAPKHDPKPVDHLSKLPTELLILIARFYLHSSEDPFPSILRLTRVNSRLRRVVIGSPNLWTSVKISDAESSHDLVRPCIERSQPLPLKIKLQIFKPCQVRDLCDRFCDVLQPAASRIRVLIIYTTTYSGLDVLRGVLETLDMPMLEEIDLDYDREFAEESDWPVWIPGEGTTRNLQTLTLSGLFPPESDLNNLKSLTLEGGGFEEWPSSAISTPFMGSNSLESLTFVGRQSIFDFDGDLMEEVLPCPSLRYLGMKGDIAADFATRFLLALNAPNLETVHVTTQPAWYENLSAPIDWAGNLYQLNTKYLKGDLTIANVRSLVIDSQDKRYSRRYHRNFFRFLIKAFPQITSLDLGVAAIGVLRIHKEENDVFDVEWAHLNKLILHGNPSPHALKRLLEFVRSRNGTGPANYKDESEEEGGDEYDEAHYADEETEEDETEREKGEDSNSKGEDGGEGGNESALNGGKHEASGVVEAGIDEDAGSSWLMPIETVVIKGRKIADAASGELLRLLREEVQVVEIA